MDALQDSKTVCGQNVSKKLEAMRESVCFSPFGLRAFAKVGT